MHQQGPPARVVFPSSRDQDGYILYVCAAETDLTYTFIVDFKKELYLQLKNELEVFLRQKVQCLYNGGGTEAFIYT